MAANSVMSAVWLLNALENSLQEANCLMKELIGEDAAQSLDADRLSCGERSYVACELKKFRERLGLTGEMIERLDAGAARAESKLREFSVRG